MIAILMQQELLPTVAIWCVLSFLAGALPFGLWIGLLWKGIDIRTLGSRNIGATNVMRVLGPGPASVAFLLDVLKGIAGITIARAMTPELPMPALVLIGMCAVLGHTFSPFLRFRGGKGISTSLGMLLSLSWPVGLIGLGFWIVIVALTRYVCLASLCAAISLPVASYLLLKGEERAWMLGMTLALLVLVTVRHRANIQRLAAGTEPKFGQRVSPADVPDHQEAR